MFRKVTYFLDGRLYEWTFAVASLGLAVEILVWPDTVQASAFRWTSLAWGYSVLMGLVFLAVSISRLVALAFNGRSLVTGPFVRSICAGVSSIMWAQFAFALLLYGYEKGTPSPGFPFWLTFSFAEVYVAYRAMIDVRRAQTVEDHGRVL